LLRGFFLSGYLSPSPFYSFETLILLRRILLKSFNHFLRLND
jgi:hypothetical protein